MEALKSRASSKNYSLAPQYIMCDFEKALRNSFQKVFPSSIILGYEFNFFKALWSKVGDYGLKKKSIRKQTSFIISAMTIFMHINNIERREVLFIKKLLIPKKSFKTFSSTIKKIG